MILSWKTITLFFLGIIALSTLPLTVHAQSVSDLTVTPVVVDGKAKARDILKETITITNTSKRKLNIYPSVNDVKPEDGQQEFVSSLGGDDEKDSLANWIEISRGVIDLQPGETREIPFVIRVSLNALPGTYHADISFFEGSTVAEAQSRSPLAVVTVNTEVQADIKEVMQLNKFVTDSFFFSGDDVLFNYQLENIGNQELKPKGEIRIYDRKGREVAAIPVNPEGKSFTPEQAAQLASAWSAAEGFGKFKAFLNIDYGNNQNGSLQDTVFFWIIPWQQLLALLVVSVTAIIISALYFHRWLEHRHMQRFAVAGMAASVGAAALQAPAVVAPKPTMPSITAVMPEGVHKEKKGFFSRFRRSKKIEAEVVPEQVSPVQHTAPIAAPVSDPIPAAVSQAVRELPPQASSQATRTIDLTSAQASVAPQRRPGHVINLKDGV